MEGMRKWIERQKEFRISEEMQAKIAANMKKTREDYWKRTRTPKQKFTFRLEVARVIIIVAIPVIAVWVFNHPRFHDFAQSIADSLDNETPQKKADRERQMAQYRRFTEQLKEYKRREERAKFLREQMAFEEAKKQRQQYNI